MQQTFHHIDAVLSWPRRHFYLIVLSPTASSHLATAPNNVSLSTQPSAGVLNVEILGARNLSPSVLGSLLKWMPNYSNSYVVLSLDRERFVSSIKKRELSPIWKETAQFNVPLPSEAEIMQTSGIPIAGSGGKMKGKDQIVKSIGAAAAMAKVYCPYQPCAPELYVQIFHRLDELKSTETTSAPMTSSSGSLHVSALRTEDKLICAVIVPLLPCLMPNASSSRNHKMQDNCKMSLDFDVSAALNELLPQKGDIVRLTGFGGLGYYSKLLPPSARIEVLGLFQYQVFVQARSQEGWPLSFELHRILVHVERRPSLFLDASEQLHNQVSRVRQLRMVTGAQRLWQALPDTPRTQLENSAAFVAFFGSQSYSMVMRSTHELLRSGVNSGVQKFVASSKDVFGQVKQEFIRVYWNAPRRMSLIESRRHHSV
ncbi:hypothetical protein PsorP6_012637 [Peronosclerospora sorghi]|uniref:Uncharacterized protein n=1 Tax=Peronosclerospora sorghi TaxID=230839 RepID=A0ACC0WFZ5_9STRA|nr:hypothetical protein PsorP6_012637 [Peronosclerospora sorghi]